MSVTNQEVKFAEVDVVILVSYASGMPGFSPSEWLSDKIEVLKSEGQPAILITSPASCIDSSPGLLVIKVPSISRRDLVGEVKSSKTSKLPYSPFTRALLFLISATFGNVFDVLFRLVAGKASDGKWSWILTSTPVVFFQAIKLRSTKIFATGGPSSAHFASVIAGIFSRTTVVLEFQDPFIGSEMGLINRTSRAMLWLETFMISKATKTIFVTFNAAKSARLRNPPLVKKIFAIYPGAWKLVQKGRNQSDKIGVFRILHLGTLYSTRNIDSLLEAVTILSRDAPIFPRGIEVHNMGDVYLPEIDDYLATKFFKQTPLLPRRQALEVASKSDCLLLVQHTDSRSTETIPYKFYDYLNLGLPVFGLVNSNELKELILSGGGYACDQGDVKATISELKRMFGDFSTGVQQPIKLHIDITAQFKQALTN